MPEAGDFLQRIECGHQLGAVVFADAQSAAIWRSSWGRDLQFRHEPPTFNRVLEVVFFSKLEKPRRFFVKIGLSLEQLHCFAAVGYDVDIGR